VYLSKECVSPPYVTRCVHFTWCATGNHADAEGQSYDKGTTDLYNEMVAVRDDETPLDTQDTDVDVDTSAAMAIDADSDTNASQTESGHRGRKGLPRLAKLTAAIANVGK
jgi:hypothetical protein